MQLLAINENAKQFITFGNLFNPKRVKTLLYTSQRNEFPQSEATEFLASVIIIIAMLCKTT